MLDHANTAANVQQRHSGDSSRSQRIEQPFRRTVRAVLPVFAQVGFRHAPVKVLIRALAVWATIHHRLQLIDRIKDVCG
jgi:hypothetical protein